MLRDLDKTLSAMTEIMVRYNANMLVADKSAKEERFLSEACFLRLAVMQLRLVVHQAEAFLLELQHERRLADAQALTVLDREDGQ